MARGARYRVPLKRRREGKTNYYKRRKLIISGKPRLVVRVLSRTAIVQIAKATPKGDVVIASAHSNELKKYGWKGYRRNTPALYLLGFLAAKKALKQGVTEAIVDIGLHRPVKASRVFAAVKGALDAGLKIPVGDGVLPEDDRVRGEHIANYAKMLKESNPELFKLRFSGYLSAGLDPESLPEHFDSVKQKIEEALQ
ncbi:50S ribosomal protein L18 [Thermofilum pendens]|uniref:Large ribosomal subunit protein uL18 n=1 Tax=Thermofilum pendens (strain DSM 2475 / Hrk 5) TaxID=368408 RepID=RL18_THEPD|nr:50S ribosomal protein L18 [Thermofilum pendens]A1RWR7.1 RecName: Full=Large ribosomal subunit protein uL18; AltName: Full=50S ribosomal protein L18 [Thermofilum pendens Hrk 5]ABL77647.1 LSU ribosomal protein L18P [Thermofilum pendens Hrk 5]